MPFIANLPHPLKMAAAGVSWSKGFCKSGWLPTVQIVRHAKAVTRHWRPMHIVRQKLMEITEYIPPKPLIPERCIKPSVKPAKEEPAYMNMLYRQAKQTFLENNMIAVCQYNYVPGRDMLFMRHRLQKYNIHVKFFPNEIIIRFLLESKYKNLLPLFVSHNLLLVSPEARVKDMLRVLKNNPYVNFLGGCVDNTILSKQGFAMYAKLPSLAAAQGQVVDTLSIMGSHTSTLLQHGPLHLSCLLDQYVKQQSGEAEEAKKTDKSEAL
uniref:Large ribosomal subunit protein uL10m n=1 Tax=Salvator merianae TaxID=96440 RepID=A0A8D0AZH4_SALMN